MTDAEIVPAGLVNGSASGAERLLQCPASVVLPQSSRGGDDADRGTELHAFCRNVLTGTSVADALQKLSEEHRDTASKIDFRKLGADLTEIRCEAAYAINPRKLTARLLGYDIGRDYERFNITQDELCGSDDIEGWLDYEGVRPVVLDLKFGSQRVAPAADNAQLKVYCCARAWITGAEEVIGRICYVNPSGAVFVDEATFDRFELDAFALDLEVAFDQVQADRKTFLAGGMPTVSPGEWCRYCGALDVCPSQTALARAMVTEVDTLGANLGDLELRDRIESLTLEQAGGAWKKAKQIEGLLERVLAALKTRAMQESLPLGNGKEVRRIQMEKESFVQSRAVQMLKDKGATPGELATLYSNRLIEYPRELPVAKPKKVKR